MKVVLITFLILIAEMLFAQGNLPSEVLPDQSPLARIKDRGVKGISLQYAAGNFSVTKEETLDNTTWQHLSLPGYTLSRHTGQPQLPVHTALIVVPEGASYSWNYTASGQQIHTGFRIYPTLAPATDRAGDPEPAFGYDPVTYSTDAFYPSSPVNVTEVQEFRGMTLVWFEITPVQYNPVTGVLRVNEDLMLDIVFSGAERFMQYEQHSLHFLNNFPGVAANAGSVFHEIEQYLGGLSSSKSLPVNPSKYIMLTDSMFIDATNKLANWKRQLGFSVEVVAGSNWTYATMKTAVQSRYQAWTPKPDYLLIIGDHDQMPAQMVYNPASELFGTDLHLVTMGGPNDYIPDMAHGRLSVSSAAQAMTVVDKIIQYEKNPPVDTAFYNTGLNCAEFQDENFDNYADRRFIHTSEDVRDYLTAKGYDIKRVYSADLTNSTPLYYNAGYYSTGQSLPAALLLPSFNWNGNAGDITSRINAGAFYVLHRDHGYAGGTGWHAPYYVTSNIGSLNNGNKTPVVFSINCHTGEFTLPECFAERFQRLAPGGAVGVVAASYYSYSGWNDGFTAGMFDAIWSSPGLIPVFGAGGIYSPVVNTHPDIRNMGFVMNQGLLRMMQTWSSSPQEGAYTYRLFHYFGDPSMRIRTTIPQAITAQHTDSIQCGVSSFAVSGASYLSAMATLSIPGKIIGSVTLVNGSGNISLAPFSSPFLLLTLSGPEHIPYVDTVWVISSVMTAGVIKEDVKCHGKSEGEIQLAISCGTGPFSVTWSHGPTTPTLTQLPAGTYSYTVTDATNYSLTDSIVITEPALPLLVSGSVTDVLCYYGANGSVTINTSGGIAPYQYAWSNGQQSATLTNVAANTFLVSVTDAGGCVVVDTFVVTQPQPLQVAVGNIVHDMTNTCTGEGTALPSGGTTPYSYLWNDPAAQTTQTATGLCPGLQRVYVTDHHGCLTVKSFTLYNTSGIEEPDPYKIAFFPNPVTGSTLYISIPEDISCERLLIQLYNASGQQLWNQEIPSGTQLFSIQPFPLQKGVYQVVLQSVEDSRIITQKIIRL